MIRRQTPDELFTLHGKAVVDELMKKRPGGTGEDVINARASARGRRMEV